MGMPTIVIAAIILVLAAASCTLVDRARMYGAEAAGRAVALECALSVDERKKNLVAINGWLAAQDVTNRAVALDCDGDGMPDFQAGSLDILPR